MNPEQTLKLKFAEAWLRQPNNAFGAALSITKNNSFLAIQLCDELIYDDEVIAFKRQLLEEHGEEHFMPSKSEMFHEIYDRAKETQDPDSFGRLAKLAVEMRGFIEKPGVTINNNQTSNRVMIVPVGKLNDDGTVDADHWEKMAVKQQEVLTEQ